MEAVSHPTSPHLPETVPTETGGTAKPDATHSSGNSAGSDTTAIEQFLQLLQQVEGSVSGSGSANPNLGQLGSAFGGGDGTQSPTSTAPSDNPLGFEGSQGAQGSTATNAAGQTDFANAVTDLHGKDQEAFDQFQKDANDGNGNAMVNDIIADYKNGDLTKDQANSLALDVQQVANVNGGGKINKKERHKLQDALGNNGDVITSGHTKAADWWKEHGSQFLDGLGLAAQVGTEVATKA